VPTVVVAMILPWVFHSVGPVQLSGERAPLSLEGALAVGIWAHLLVVPAAVALGAWSSRAVARSRAIGVLTLVTGSVLAIILGAPKSPLPFLAPPLMATARAANQGVTPAGGLWLTFWALAWAALAIAGYWRVRRRRA
jgi:hypothetical protein